MTYRTTALPDEPAARRAVFVRSRFADMARWAAHYALVLIFLWFGALKFTAFEASGIAPLVMNSPALMGLQGAAGVGGSAMLIGCVEILTGLLLAVRPILPRVAAAGAAMAAITFLITVSFLFSTPGVIQPGAAAPFALSPMPGQFLLKDVACYACRCGYSAPASTRPAPVAETGGDGRPTAAPRAIILSTVAGRSADGR